MKNIDQLKEDYDKLPIADKTKLGESLVKVNLGVGHPEDLKRVAAFLKGSVLIAKAENLNELVNSLHNHESSINDTHTDKTQVLVSNNLELNKTQIRNLASFEEDSEITHKDKLD